MTGSCGCASCEPRVLQASLNTVANVINADVKTLVAGAREMGLSAFLKMVDYAPAQTLANAAV